MVVVKYPLRSRLFASLMCILPGLFVANGRINSMTVVLGCAALFLTVAVWTYQVVITKEKITIRYFPLWTREIPMEDLEYLDHKGNIILGTKTSRIRLWGLSEKADETLFSILPKHIDFVVKSRSGKIEISQFIRILQLFTIVSGTGFIITAIAVIPYFDGNSMHDHWNTTGKSLLRVCFIFSLATIFGAAYTWIYWSMKRDFDKIANRKNQGRH